MPARRVSLLAALFGRVLALLSVTAALIGALAFWSARDQVGRAYDDELRTAAEVLYALMADELAERAAPADPKQSARVRELLSAEDRAAFDRYARDRAFRVWYDARLVYASRRVPAGCGDAPPPGGFRDCRARDEIWRTYALSVPRSRVVVEIGERSEERRALIRAIALELAVPLALLVPAAAGLVWLTLADGLRRLRALTTELHRRSLRDLTELDTALWPPDLAPLIEAVNQLFRRLSSALRRERGFIDRAAHQLRTPLATIKVQTQLAARESDEATRRRLLADLQRSVDRAVELGDGLLTLARLESESEALDAADLDVAVRAALADLAPYAASRGVQLAYAGGPVQVRGDERLLRTIAANLVENAIRHSPESAEVSVAVAVSAEGPTLAVEDLGPGVAPEARARVFDRFHRGASNGGHAGLGLAIVAEAVRIVGGEVRLGDRVDGASGLRVEVLLRAAAAQAA